MEKRVEFRNEKGEKLVGVLHVPEKEEGEGIILVHGYTGNKDEHGFLVNLARRLCERGFLVLRFDFSGHGESEGHFDGIEKEVKELRRAMKFVGRKRLILIGLSLGAVVSVLAWSKRVVKLILLNPGTYIPEVRRVKCPILIIQGGGDDPSNVQDSKKTYEASREPKRYVEVPGAGHVVVDPLHQSQFVGEIINFITFK
ncbi:MAG: alpha/beta fold hydrolase [Nanoarchaeota archaeon]|nr:alpha/beta fold hydrolase [Nanoarchaeota archaeon]